MPPTTSSLARVVVDEPPISTWLVVVETRIAELLNQVQFISPVPPEVESPAPVSVPATARLPAASIVVVAVAPKRAAEALSVPEVNELVVVAAATVRLVRLTRVGREKMMS